MGMFFATPQTAVDAADRAAANEFAWYKTLNVEE